MRTLLLLLGLFACSAPVAGGDGPGGDGAIRDGGPCTAPNVMRFEQPGCDQPGYCGSPGMDLCLRRVCSCTGRVIGGCDYYGEPWLRVPVPQGAAEGDPCSTDGAIITDGAPDPR
jgi:hypothetical protein